MSDNNDDSFNYAYVKGYLAALDHISDYLKTQHLEHKGLELYVVENRIKQDGKPIEMEVKTENAIFVFVSYIESVKENYLKIRELFRK